MSDEKKNGGPKLTHAEKNLFDSLETEFIEPPGEQDEETGGAQPPKLTDKEESLFDSLEKGFADPPSRTADETKTAAIEREPLEDTHAPADLLNTMCPSPTSTRHSNASPSLCAS